MSIPTITVQLKGKSIHADRAHTAYWLKATGFINLYWHVCEGIPAKIFLKGNNAG